MSAHTPGPWEVREQDGEYRVHAADTRELGFRLEMRIVDQVGGYNIQREDGTWDGAQREANAVLLAAAPTMLTAIEQFETWWVEYGAGMCNGEPACVFALREAAALARGES